jgi:hypothetical protein
VQYMRDLDEEEKIENELKIKEASPENSNGLV